MSTPERAPAARLDGKASLRSVSSLIGLQLFSRIATFAFNQILFRYASPEAYGTAAVQFELILSTILFLSREGVRNALLRAWPQKPTSPHHDSRPYNAALNLASVPLVVGLPIAAVTTLSYIFAASKDTQSQALFQPAVLTYAIAAVIELMSEPLHNQAMGEGLTSVRVSAEGLGITGKSLATCGMLLFDSWSGYGGELALLAFGLGQLAYSVLVVVAYSSRLGWPQLWPVRLTGIFPRESATAQFSSFFNTEALQLALSMTYHSLIKHLLTEGDKVIVSWWSPLDGQGGYALAVNYGSLVARIVFQPVEEICRLYFSKLLSETNTSKAKAQRESDSANASSALMTLISVQLAFSALVLVFGHSYLPIALHVLLPPQYLATSAPQVLSAWVWYIPFLAINGGLEAFLSSVMTPSQVRSQSRWMIAFSVVYISSAITLYSLGFGDAALVYANIINLSARIVYALEFTSSYFLNVGRPLDWRAALPHKYFVAMVWLSYTLIETYARRAAVMKAVEESGRQAVFSRVVVSHIALGGVLGILCLTSWWILIGSSLRSSYLHHKKD